MTKAQLFPSLKSSAEKNKSTMKSWLKLRATGFLDLLDSWYRMSVNHSPRGADRDA